MKSQERCSKGRPDTRKYPSAPQNAAVYKQTERKIHDSNAKEKEKVLEFERSHKGD